MTVKLNGDLYQGDNPLILANALSLWRTPETKKPSTMKYRASFNPDKYREGTNLTPIRPGRTVPPDSYREALAGLNLCSVPIAIGREGTDIPKIEKQKSPNLTKGALFKIGHRPTLPPVTAVPLALAGLTSLFGMGRGGHRRYRHLKILELKAESRKLKAFERFLLFASRFSLEIS